MVMFVDVQLHLCRLLFHGLYDMIMAYFVLEYFTVFVITSTIFGSGTVFTVCLSVCEF